MRLIDADKVKEKLRGNAQNDGTAFAMVIVKMLCEILDQAPTVEEAEEHDEILKKHRAFVMARIDGHGCHIGTYKGLSLEADGDWIINVDVEGVSVTGQGDFAPVVHARWETNPDDIYWGNTVKRKHCTACKKEPHFDREKREFILTDYCPNCGAKMCGGEPDD